MRPFVIIVYLMIANYQLEAQQNRLKLGVMGMPLGEGFGTGSLAYERLNQPLSQSWQFSFSGSFGEVAMDAGAVNRIWGTAEKIFYKKTSRQRITWSYSFFIEAGTRETKAGKVYTTPEKTFQKTKAFEINPGAALGLQYRLGKKWQIEALAGPKLIFAKGNDYYYNSINTNIFTERANDVRVGYRINGLLSYQF